MATFREGIEMGLLRLPCVRRFTEREARFIEDYKDGTFGLSYLGFLLYCNGNNPRGLSKSNPNGLIYFDRENLFGIGIFRRAHEKDRGNLMLVAPRGINAAKAIGEFAEQAVETVTEIRGQMLYVRFLKETQLKELLQHGFSPVQEEPWHPEAFAEDETFNHSVVNLADYGTRRNKEALSRFGNFLKHHNIELEASNFSPSEAKEVIISHFEMLKAMGKDCGSVSEDYFNVIEAGKEGRFAMLMKMRGKGREIVSSAFIGEKISERRMALYCTISRRDPDLYAKALGLEEPLTGFSALSTCSFIRAFDEIRKEFPEVEEVHLGGSETAELNAFKRRLGARNEPTYWAVKEL